MSHRARVWLIVAGSYVLARLGARVFALGALPMSGELVAQLVAVPVAQIAALEIVRRAFGKRWW